MKNIIACIMICGLWAASAQENSMANVPKSLLECYKNTYLLDKNNKLPQNIQSLLAILRKIEDTPGLNMDLRTLSVALLHRFRQDGIVQYPHVVAQTGVTPFAPNGYQFHRQAETLKLIPGNAISFPNDSISSVERCSLHSMVSTSIYMLERGDESTTCRDTNSPYRRHRSLKKRSPARSSDVSDDVETLTAEQLETLSRKDDASKHDVDPNSWYPPLPPNHPDSAKLFALPPQSKCPLENGVIKTEWGTIAGGAILAGIAAGLQPQNVRLRVLLKEEWQSRDALSSTTLDNKWIATIAGDLAEVALLQGPLADKPMTIGVEGHWNSTFLPRWYFLNANENLYYTAAEIRGDLDGLILASEIANWYSRVPSLRLSQIIDMYYSDRGVFNTTIRACNRKNLLIPVAPNDTITAQAFRSALVLSPGVARVTIDPATIEKFAVQASEQLFAFIPSMDNPLCSSVTKDLNFRRISTDLTIVLDPNWPFATIQPMLAALLENLEISKYNSNFTIISADEKGRAMINSTNSILDFYEFNETQYSTFSGKFNLPASFNTIISMEKAKLDEERNRGSGGGRSEVILIVPYTSRISDDELELCKEQLKKLREEVPDATFKFLVPDAKDRWSNLVQDPNTDIFLVGSVSSGQNIWGPIHSLLTSMKQVPRRLINSQCGSDNKPSGSWKPHEDYLEPSGVNFYRLHPNYFYRSDAGSSSTITIQPSAPVNLVICSSRDPMDVDSTVPTCENVQGNSHTLTFNCQDAGFIHRCNPLYLSVGFNSSTNTAYQCTDNRFCRYPDMIKYTISYNNLVCVSSASTAIISPLVLVLLTIYSYLHYF